MMKQIYAFLFLLAFGSMAFASSVGTREVMIARTKFVAIPIYDKYSVQLSNVPNEMNQSCSQFKRLMDASQNFSRKSRSARLVDYRETVGPWQDAMDPRFKLELKIDSSRFRNILDAAEIQSLASYSDRNMQNEALPLMAQLPESLQV